MKLDRGIWCIRCSSSVSLYAYNVTKDRTSTFSQSRFREASTFSYPSVAYVHTYVYAEAEELQAANAAPPPTELGRATYHESVQLPLTEHSGCDRHLCLVLGALVIRDTMRDVISREEKIRLMVEKLHTSRGKNIIDLKITGVLPGIVFTSILRLVTTVEPYAESFVLRREVLRAVSRRISR